MDEYTDAWNREDVDAIEHFYHYPFFSFKDGALEVYLLDDGGANTRSWIEVNREAGPAMWERHSTSVTRQGRNSVLVTSDWSFTRPDGTNVWSFTDTFHLCRFGGMWQFLDRTLHDR